MGKHHQLTAFWWISLNFSPTNQMQLRWSVFTSKSKQTKTSCKAPYDWKPNKHGWFPTLFVGLCVSCNAVWRNGFAMSNVDIIVDPNFAKWHQQGQNHHWNIHIDQSHAASMPTPLEGIWGSPLFEGRFWKFSGNFLGCEKKPQCQVGGGHLEQNL